MYYKLLYALLLSVAGYATNFAQIPGSLDTTYGTDGKTLLPIGTANAFGRDMVIQPDGKTIVACIVNNGTDTDFAIARFTTEGDPDKSLDGDGIVTTDFDAKSDIAEAIALDEFNRIIVGGSVDSGDGFGFAAVRYLDDGTLDESFGDTGLVTRMLGITGFCKSIAVQSDQKIVLGGYVLNPVSQTNEFVLMRFHSDGTPDSTFNDDGIVMTNMGIGAGIANAMLIQPDDKIVLAGQVLNEATFRWEIGIARYNEDGSPDETWDEDGIVFTGSMDADFTIKEVALQADHKIVVGGYFGTAPSNNLFTVARYHTDGRLDDSFGEEGIVLGSYGAEDNQVNTIVIQPDEKILIAGTSLQGNRDLFAIARLDSAGEFDDSFGDQGVVRPAIDQNDGIHSMALQQDGKLVVAGESFDGQRFLIAVARIETGLITATDDPIQLDIHVTVYPNPASEEIIISCRTLRSGPVRMVLTDLTGKVLHEFALQAVHDAVAFEANYKLPANLPCGMYVLTLISSEVMKGVKLNVVK